MHRCDRYYLRLTIIPAILLLWAAASVSAQIVPTNDPPVYGPYNVVSLQGGDGVHKNMVAKDTVLRADSPWTIYGWVQIDAPITAPVLAAGMGDVAAEYSRYLGLDSGKLMLWAGADNSFSAPATVTPGKWQFIAASFDGAAFHLYSDGAQVGQGSLILGTVAPVLQIAPPVIPWPNGQHFGGRVAGFTLTRQALTADEIKRISSQPPDFALLAYEEGSKPWRVQTRGQAGYRAPQDPATLPKSRASILSPVAKPMPAGRAALQADGDSQWTIAGGWQMAAAPKVKASPQDIAKAGFDSRDWLAGTVAGTALAPHTDLCGY